jgi:triacylglycerol lipase
VSTVVLALLALLLVATVVVALVVRRRLRRPAPLEGVEPIPGETGRGPPLPIVLVHGLFGFDRIGVPGVKLHYFRGIVKHLESLGCHAHAVRLPAAKSVPERAKILVDRITALDHDKVDIIAHSLGGLDARYALSKLGLASRVRSLVTIGTPHHGTPLASFATNGALGLARKAVGVLGFKLEALDWLSPAALEKFNTEVPDVPGVRYACVVGGIRESGTPVALAIAPTHAYLRRVAGPNDGLVPISSQYWGETLAEIEADHWEQVGWGMTMRGSFDALAMYAFIVARLGDVKPIAASA